MSPPIAPIVSFSLILIEIMFLNGFSEPDNYCQQSAFFYVRNNTILSKYAYLFVIINLLRRRSLEATCYTNTWGNSEDACSGTFVVDFVLHENQD
ncbi:unnamed protein product [Rhizophagus irregularis]|nr:unnamed protein product [Rhizophagus irregularis]